MNRHADERDTCPFGRPTLKKVLIGFVAVACAVAAPVFGQGAQRPVSGAVYVLGFPSTTHLDAQGITDALKPATGKATYENDGNYPGVAAYAHFPRKLGVDFSLFTGSADKVDPEIANGYRGMNPLTEEHITVWDLGGTYTLFASQRHGMVDLLVGYLALHADPGPLTVPANPAIGDFSPYVIDNGSTTYSGLSLGVKGYFPFHQRVGVDYKLQYLPTYSASGYYDEAGDSTLDPEDIFRYRFGLNVYLHRFVGLTAGYQRIRLNATLAQGPRQGSASIVENYGFYFGGMVNF